MTKLFPLHWQVKYKWPKINTHTHLPTWITTKVIQLQNQELPDLTNASVSHFNQQTPLEGERAGLGPSTLTAKRSSHRANVIPAAVANQTEFLFILALVETQQQLLS